MEYLNRVKEQALEPIHFYQSLGFFQNYEKFSDTEIFADLAAKVNITEEFYSNTEYWDNTGFLLLGTDKERILWIWPELGRPVEPGDFTDLLIGLGKISRGIFEPSNIKETWDEEDLYNPDAPPTVTFDYKGQTFTARITWFGDFLDLGIVATINKIISPTGYRFEELRERSVENIFMLLTQLEKQALERERNHQFN